MFSEALPTTEPRLYTIQTITQNVWQWKTYVLVIEPTEEDLTLISNH